MDVPRQKVLQTDVRQEDQKSDSDSEAQSDSERMSDEMGSQLFQQGWLDQEPTQYQYLLVGIVMIFLHSAVLVYQWCSNINIDPPETDSKASGEQFIYNSTPEMETDSFELKTKLILF